MIRGFGDSSTSLSPLETIKLSTVVSSWFSAEFPCQEELHIHYHIYWLCRPWAGWAIVAELLLAVLWSIYNNASCIMSIQCINEISRPGDLFKGVNPWIWVHIGVLLFRPSEWQWHSASLYPPLEHHFWILAKSIKDASPSAISICIFQNQWGWSFYVLLTFPLAFIL